MRGSSIPKQHAFVLFGIGEPRADYVEAIEAFGCTWAYTPKKGRIDVLAYYSTIKAAVKLAPSVLILHGVRLLPLSLIHKLVHRKIPIVGIHHGPAIEVTNVNMRLVSIVFSLFANRSITVSSEMLNLINRHLILKKMASPLTLISNGLDTKFWQGESLNWNEKTPLNIGMVATLANYKNQPMLLKAFQRICEVRQKMTLYLIGMGPRYDEFKELANTLNISNKVVFEGNLNRAQVRDRLRTLHLLVHCSHSESFGMSVAEGMAANRPVIATRVVGMKGLILHGKTGWLVEDNDVDGLVSVILQVIKDPKKALEVASEGCARIEKLFSASRMANEYETLFYKILS